MTVREWGTVEESQTYFGAGWKAGVGKRKAGFVETQQWPGIPSMKQISSSVLAVRALPLRLYPAFEAHAR